MIRSRRVRWLILVGSLYLAGCTIGGIYLADGALHPVRRELTEAEISGTRNAAHAMGVELADASITTSDEVTLRGWILRPARTNGNAVLLPHGLADNRLGMGGYAQMLVAHGFTVLLADARAHGVSGGSLATYGLLERNDIRQWVEFVSARIHPHCVFGMGESMGAAQLLQSLEAGAEFCAVIAESPFANFREIAYDRMGQPFHLGPRVGRTILRPLVEIAFLRARWKYKLNMEEVSPEEAVMHSRVPVLLVHGEIDRNIPVRHSLAIHAVAPQTVLWEVPGADHCGAIAAAPEEFQKRVLGWFERAPQLSTVSSAN
jgi:uncharacterized protein